MSELTDTSQSPYYDDFSRDKEYYKVLFKPAVPLQTRELNQIQSIFQNQIENLSSVNYKDGEIVSGANIGVNKNLNAVLLQPLLNNVYTDTILNSLVGSELTGSITNIKAVVVDVVTSTESLLNLPTIYVNYLSTGVVVNDTSYQKYTTNEKLVDANGNVVCICIPDAPTDKVGSQVSIQEGILYYKGYFLNILPQNIFLNYYDNTPTYKIGLLIEESIATTTNDSSLYDNASNFSNYNAIGADRLKISVNLVKLNIDSNIPANFVEILRIRNGNIEYKIDNTISHQITDAIAQRTFDLFGNFTAENFKLTTKETLNTLSNNGVYNANSTDVDGFIVLNKEPLITEVTSINGNNYINLGLEPGTAYIRGHEYNYSKSTSTNVEKARSTKLYENQVLDVDCGQYFEIFNNIGKLDITNEYKLVNLYNKPQSDPNKLLIGTALAISIINNNTLLGNDIRLYFVDLSTYSILTTTVVNLQLSVGDYVYGATSNASGYVTNYTGNTITIEHQTGEFLNNEVILNSRNNNTANLTAILDNTSENVKSIAYQSLWYADTKLSEVALTGTGLVVSGGNTVTGTNTKFLEELTIGSSIKLENRSAFVTSIINDTEMTVVDSFGGTFANQNISTVYKQITSIQYKNKNLYLTSPELYIKSTDNKKFSVSKQYVVTFAAGEADVPYQVGAEIPNGIVLVQAGGATFTAQFITATRIKISNNILSNATAVITVELLKLTPTNAVKTNSINNILRVNKTKTDITHTKYGIRYEDSEISIGFPDVNKINFIRYSRLPKTSPNYVSSCFDNILVASAVNINVGDVLTDGNSIATVVVISANLIYVHYITKSQFTNNTNITNWTNSTIVNIVTVTSGDYIDVTNNYTLIRNDNEHSHDISKLKLVNQYNIPTNDLVVSFNYFQSTAGDFSTIDSYQNIDYPEIYQRNIIDFRLISAGVSKTGAGTIINPYILNEAGLNPSERTLLFKSIPANNTEFLYDYTYYVGRIDLVVLNALGEFKTITGVPDNIPTPPKNTGELLLATIEIPPYTFTTEEIKITSNNTRKHNFAEINDIDERLGIIEKDIALTKLEAKTNNVNIIDTNGLNKIKTGFATDEFGSLLLSDIKNPQYNASIDVLSSTLVPRTNSVNIELVPNYNNSINFKKTGDILSIDYTEVSSISQSKSTNTDTVNNFNTINWQGVVTCTPNANNWASQVYDSDNDISTPNNKLWKILSCVDDKQYPKLDTLNTALSTDYKTFAQQQFIKISSKALKPNTQLKLLLNNINMNNYTIPALCSVIKGGTEGTNNIPFMVGEPLVWYNPNKNTLIGSTHQPAIKSDIICGYVKAFNDFETTKNPLAINSNLPTNYSGSTNLLYIDWVDIVTEFNEDDYKLGAFIIGATSGAICKLSDNRIITNEYGSWDGVLIIPSPKYNTNIKFDTKNISLLLSDTNQSTTFAETNFQTYGSSLTNTNNILSTRIPSSDDGKITSTQVSSTNISTIDNWYNPLAQLFVISDLGGCQLTGVELFFSQKDSTLPVIVQIRTVENNVPTELIVPFSEVVINAKDINVSADSSVGTKINFNGLVYLKENTKYAITVLTNSNKYKVFFANIGSTDILTNTKVDTQTYSGTLYKSQNTTTWNPTKDSYLKFTLYKAKFNILQTSKVRLFNTPNRNKSITNNNLSLTNSSNVINIQLNNHGLHRSQNSVTIKNVISENAPTVLNTVMNDSQVVNNNITILVEKPESFDVLVNNQAISAINPGYIKINDEIITYIAVNTSTKLLTIPIGGRGQNTTPITAHDAGSIVEPYILSGIPLTEINKTFNTVTPIDLHNFQIITTSVSNKTIAGGGTNIIISKNIQYESLANNVSSLVYQKTKLTGVISTTTNNSIDNTTQTAYLTNIQSFNSTDTADFNIPMVIASPENEVANNNNTKSLIYELELSSENINISPIIDTSKLGLIVISNNIDNKVTNETIPEKSDSEFVYVTKPIKLLSVSTGISVILDAYRLASHNISVYARIYRTDNIYDFDKQTFKELTVVKYPASTKTDQFNEFLFEARNLPQFTEFQIKIVGKSSSQTSYPKIKNLRNISVL